MTEQVEIPEQLFDPKQVRRPQRGPTTLDAIYMSHWKWLYLEDTKVIDLKLAMEICRQMFVEDAAPKPVWMNLVGPSSIAKSDMFDTLLKGMAKTTYRLRSLTRNALVTGLRGAEDLAPKLDGKLVILPDASRLTSLGYEEKTAIFSQLRDLYDGYAGKHTGSGTSPDYSGLKITWLMGAVPAIEREIIWQGTLGPRSLSYYYRPPPSRKAMDMSLKRMEYGKLEMLKAQTGELERQICRTVESDRGWRQVNIEPVKDELMNRAEKLTVMRATADADRRSGELWNIPYKEEPVRAFGQFVTLYKALMALYKHAPGLPDQKERALEIIERVALSSGDRNRAAVLTTIEALNPSATTEVIAEELRMWRIAVKRHCNILWALELVEKKESTYQDPTGRTFATEEWSIKS